MFLALLIALLVPNFTPSNNPPYQPRPGDPQTAEEAARYEALYTSCAGAEDPNRCRSDLAAQYGYYR